MGEAFLFKGKWAKPTLEEGKSPIFSLKSGILTRAKNKLSVWRAIVEGIERTCRLSSKTPTQK